MRQFGSYTDLVEISRGGMAVVYRAKTPQGTLVALKLLHPMLLGDPVMRKRFAQEASFRLHHPNIVPVLDYGEHNGTPFIVMEYVSGESLAALIARRGLLSPQQLAPILEAVASALDYAHRNGVIHRDVKAANILLRHDGSVLLTDFGIACLADGSSPTLTRGQVGSVLFMSPEQVLGNPPTPSSDIYSLGVTLYLALTGKHPFMADNDVAIARMHVEATPKHVCTVNPRVPRAVGDVVMWALNKQPAQRPSSAGSLARAFYAALSAPPLPEELRRTTAPQPALSPGRVTLPQRRPAPSWLLLAAWLAVLLVLGAGVVGLFISNVNRSEATLQNRQPLLLSTTPRETATSTALPLASPTVLPPPLPTPATATLLIEAPAQNSSPARPRRPTRKPLVLPTPFPQFTSEPMLPPLIETPPPSTAEAEPPDDAPTSAP